MRPLMVDIVYMYVCIFLKRTQISVMESLFLISMRSMRRMWNEWNECGSTVSTQKKIKQTYGSSQSPRR